MLFIVVQVLILVDANLIYLLQRTERIVGEILVFSGQLVHEARAITRGKRFVLSGFLVYDEAYIRLKRSTTLATMAYFH